MILIMLRICTYIKKLFFRENEAFRKSDEMHVSNKYFMSVDVLGR